MKQFRHILIIRLSAMGDIAMTMPVVYAFAKAYPEITITFLTKPFFAPIVETMSNLRVVNAEVKSKHKGIWGLWKLSRELKKSNIDGVIDLHNVLRSKVIRLFLRVPSASINKGRAEKKAITRIKNKAFGQLKTTVQRYVETFGDLGFSNIHPTQLEQPDLIPKVSTFVGTDHKKWIGIAPYAAHQGKQYPIDLMRTVIDVLDNTTGVTLFLFGAPQEKEVLRELTKECKQVKIIAGALSFKEELNLIAHLDVMLAMDSGNAHLAAMFGIPTVTVWGVTHPYVGFAPFKQEEHCLIADRRQYPEIPTSVYGNIVPEGYEKAMETITPDSIIKKLTALLK